MLKRLQHPGRVARGSSGRPFFCVDRVVHPPLADKGFGGGPWFSRESISVHGKNQMSASSVCHLETIQSSPYDLLVLID